MTDYFTILNNISSYVSLTQSEKDEFTSIITPARIKKKQFIIQPGFVCHSRTYIVEGSFRVFHKSIACFEFCRSLGRYLHNYSDIVE